MTSRTIVNEQNKRRRMWQPHPTERFQIWRRASAGAPNIEFETVHFRRGFLFYLDGICFVFSYCSKVDSPFFLLQFRSVSLQIIQHENLIHGSMIEPVWSVSLVISLFYFLLNLGSHIAWSKGPWWIMYIKRLEIDGFKSYSKLQVIDGFDTQFNAITGEFIFFHVSFILYTLPSHFAFYFVIWSSWLTSEMPFFSRLEEAIDFLTNIAEIRSIPAVTHWMYLKLVVWSEKKFVFTKLTINKWIYGVHPTWVGSRNSFWRIQSRQSIHVVRSCNLNREGGQFWSL